MVLLDVRLKRRSASEITEDDILRFLAEEGKSVGKSRVIAEVGERELAEKAIADLEEKGLVKSRGDLLELTEKGKAVADKIYIRHKAIEDVFNKLNITGHIAAHYIEHLELDPSELRKLLKGRVETLTNLNEGDTGRILVVMDPRPSVVARLYGVGLLPGRWFKMLSKNPGVVIVMVGYEARVVSVDKDIASKVLVTIEEE